jgi:hypothetical protein
MTVRGRAVILKLNFSKSCDHKKSFLLGHSVRNSNVHPVDDWYITLLWLYTGWKLYLSKKRISLGMLSQTLILLEIRPCFCAKKCHWFWKSPQIRGRFGLGIGGSFFGMNCQGHGMTSFPCTVYFWSHFWPVHSVFFGPFLSSCCFPPNDRA